MSGHADLWPREPEPDEPECDVCDDSREIVGWDEPKIPCPFCTLVLLPTDETHTPTRCGREGSNAPPPR